MLETVKLLQNLDLYIAGVLLLAIVFVFIASRIGVLPKKSAPIFFGGLAAVFGVYLFKKWQGAALDDRMRELDEQIKRRDEELARLERSRQATRQELDA